ncbi:hypothetical protein CC80DRAFT_535005 [Byssothecium circinans]|uniref:Uncharacterized protein n=1 Tax=Byssothecium circinans TaxID=147558 RepID=A0A6A5TXI6_9PLEO|nr:hypothetical protein CC80DRAFT_535005 [Byssothecium circinans]
MIPAQAIVSAIGPIAVLIHYFRFLTTLRFTGKREDFTQAMAIISQAYLSPNLTPERLANLPFRHLTTVAVAHYDTEGCNNPNWCRYFFAIPALQYFLGDMIGAHEDRDDDEELHPRETPLGYGRSNVKEVVFTNSQIPVSVLKDILARTKALERFSYRGSMGTVSTARYQPKKVLGLLAEYAAHSLEHLALEYEWLTEELSFGSDWAKPDDDHVSLRSFENLKTLKLDWRMLYPKKAVPVEGPPSSPPNSLAINVSPEPQVVGQYAADYDIHTLLPESLESLHIAGPFHDADWEDINVTFEERSPLTPKLSNVFIQRTRTHGDTRPEDREGGTEPREKLPFTQNNAFMWSLLKGHLW